MKEEDERNAKTLDLALERLSKNGWWIFWLFVLASSPGIFNAVHITSYVFLSDSPPFWCNVPQLKQANWTDEQIRIINSPYGLKKNESCSMYDWNYKHLAEIGYEAAVNFTSSQKKPNLIPCKSYIYIEATPKESIVSEWDLVCEDTSLRSTVQVSIAIGKFVGAFIFGLLADKFGRKRSFVLSSILYMISGPLAAIVNSYSLFIFARFLIGIAGSGVYESAYTILTEITIRNYRTRLGCIFNISYPIGLMMLPLIALVSKDWRVLQLSISVPAVILLVHCWFLPESPRWLLTQGRRKEAWSIVKEKEENTEQQMGELGTNNNQNFPSDQNESSQVGHPWYKKLLTSMSRLFKLFSTRDLRHRILICYFGWFVASLSYYAIALNAHNFTANRYLYVALNGVAEAPGYIIPLPILAFFGRRITSAVLFLIGGFALLSILAVPAGYSGVILFVALIGRFCMCAVFTVIILQTSELFPTANRNTAIGTSLTMAQLGSIAAPYIVDLLGIQAWYIPSTICGSLALVSGLVFMILPETKDRPLVDTIEEMNETQPNQKVSFANCCIFS